MLLLINTENKLVATIGKEGGGKDELGERDKKG